MTTLLESRARPYGSRKGAAISMLIHGALIGLAVFATGRIVIPPREKIEEHPVLFVAAPPPPPIEAPPQPLPKVAAPPKAKEVFRAPPKTRAAPPKPVQRPVAQVPPKGPTTPALVAPTKIALSIPAIDSRALPTISDVVAPAVAEPIRSSGVGDGKAKGDADDAGGGSGKGLSSGSSGKAFDENQVDRAVEVTRRADPRYPDALKSVGVQGVVMMRYIVGADGRVEPGSIEVLSSPQRLFSEAVRNALLNSRYRPAEFGGRKVRQLVEQSFSFKLQ